MLLAAVCVLRVCCFYTGRDQPIRTADGVPRDWIDPLFQRVCVAYSKSNAVPTAVGLFSCCLYD